MSTAELRHYIIEKLSYIDDISFLKAIKTIVESKADEKVYQLSDFKRSVRALIILTLTQVS